MKSLCLSLALLLPAAIPQAVSADDDIAAALASPNRPQADIDRDATRKPAEVLEFFAIEPGMTILEVFSGGGYYTQILDAVVGDAGRVLSHNNTAYLDYVGAEYEARYAAGSLPNTEQILAELDELSFPPDSLDAVLLIQTWHDFLYGAEGWPDPDEGAFLDKLCTAMKPGSVLGVIDHAASPGDDPGATASSLHRVDPAVVRVAILGHCFETAGEIDVLANPADDHTGSATQAPMRGQTDRFIMKFVRKG